MIPWIPFFQSLIWPIFIAAIVIYFRSTCCEVLAAIAERIKKGAGFKAGPSGIELSGIGKEVEGLAEVIPSSLKAEVAPTDWRRSRIEEYERTGGYMLVHVCQPSTTTPNWYEIYLFLVQHQKGTSVPPRRDLQEILKVEFFFGDSWGNRTFPVENVGSMIGIRTRAWGTFLACCRIYFRDESRPPIVLFRYVDFHMLQGEFGLSRLD